MEDMNLERSQLFKEHSLIFRTSIKNISDENERILGADFQSLKDYKAEAEKLRERSENLQSIIKSKENELESVQNDLNRQTKDRDRTVEKIQKKDKNLNSLESLLQSLEAELSSKNASIRSLSNRNRGSSSDSARYVGIGTNEFVSGLDLLKEDPTSHLLHKPQPKRD